jgi:multidrug efflux system membrane fusion protein
MMNKGKIIGITALAVLIFISGLFAARFFSKSSDHDNGQTIGSPSNGTIASNSKDTLSSIGETELTIDDESQQLSGITTEKLKAFISRGSITAYGQVLDLQSLIDLRDNYVTFEANVKRSTAQIMVSRNEYSRAKTLFNFNKNVSIKDLQSAEAAFDSDVADSEAAIQNLTGLKGEIRRQWGDVITNWIAAHSPNVKDLIENRLSIILITVPTGTNLPQAPETAKIQTADGKILSAHFISISPKTNPSIQGVNYLYSAPAHASLSSGTNIVAHFLIGQKMEGVVIPDNAVVWWNGDAWIYVKTAEDEFHREMVSLTDRVAGGWFISEGAKPGDEIVIKGAQLLLSQELKPQVKAGQEEDD